MFATLRYGRQADDDLTCLEQTTRPPQAAQSNQRSACAACRSKKLKCTGEKTGCERCRNRGINCEYITDKSRDRRRKRDPNANRPETPISRPASQVVESPVIGAPPHQEMDIASLRGIPQTLESGGIEAELAKPSDLSGGVETMSAVNNISGLDALVGAPPRIVGSHDLGDDTGLFLEDNSYLKDVPLSLDRTLFPGIGGFANGPVTPSLESLLNFDVLEPRGKSAGTETSNSFTDSGIDTLSVANTPAERLRAQSKTPNPRPLEGIASSQKDQDDPNSGDPSQAEQTPTQGGSRCACMETALQILQNLVAQPAIMDVNAAEQVLAFLKVTIHQCETLLGCEECKSSSGFLTLLFVMCEKTVGVFEQLAGGWSRQHGRSHGGHGGTAERNSEGNLLLGDYRIDTLEERQGVFGFLVSLQLKRLASLVAKLQERAAGVDGRLQLASPRSIDHRIKAMEMILKPAYEK